MPGPAYTFDPALSNERDWVRLLLGDTDMSSPWLEDATYDAVLASRSRYCAAADLAQVIFARWQVAGAGVVEKQVSKLRLKRASGADIQAQFNAYVIYLRERCSESRLASPGGLKVL